MRADSDDPAVVGAKAANLRRMAAAHLPVPPFVVLPESLRRRFLTTLGAAPDADAIGNHLWPADCREAVRQALADLPGAGPLAVRSSMAGEDGARFSFAGQLDSFLRVPADVDESDSRLLAAIQACWASAMGERAQLYRQRHGLPVPADARTDLRMGVIVQRMADARAAGVLFTMDPVSGDPSTFVLSVALGTGEDLVRGAVPGETVRLERAEGRALDPCGLLDAGEISCLWSTARVIEDLFGVPQDIEFAFGADGLAVLQARPVLGGGALADETAERILWDNSNITESYAGVTTPLTLSLIRPTYADVYRQFLYLMGVRDPDEDMLQSLLGFYHGQVFYQLDQWYAALALLPAFQQNRAFMEQMMGVKQASAESPRGPRGGRWRLARWVGRMIVLHLRSAGMTVAFHERVGAVLAATAAQDLDGLTPRRLHGVFRTLETEVLGNWRAPILADFMAMIFFGTLRRLSERWLADTPQIHADLMAAEGSMESLAPLRRVAELAAMVREREDLHALFRLPADEAWARLRDDPGFGPMRSELTAYLDRYGDRCMNELKLEEPNLRDDPARLVRIIAASASRPVGRAAGDGDGRRREAEARVALLPVRRRLVYRWALGNARRYVRDRENQRFVRSRVFGQLRRIFRAMGEHLVQAGRVDDPADVFYLTVDEVWSEVTGTAISLDLRGIVRLRRAEYDAFRRESWSERFETLGPPYWQAPRPLVRAATTPSVAAGGSRAPDLQGTGCCSGEVTGRVRFVRAVDDALEMSGEVLVAARTDPGWVFLFPAAAALLVERGSPLSHSAIVARELGLPAIVNIPGLTDYLHTGDLVALDGVSGAIWLLERAT